MDHSKFDGRGSGERVSDLIDKTTPRAYRHKIFVVGGRGVEGPTKIYSSVPTFGDEFCSGTSNLLRILDVILCDETPRSSNESYRYQKKKIDT